MKPDEKVDKICAFTFCLKFCKSKYEIQKSEMVGDFLKGVGLLTLTLKICVVQSKYVLLESSGYH